MVRILMARPDDITLSPVFAAVAASGLDIESLVTATPTTTRLPRLEVPIDVQALRVAPAERVEHADVATTANLEALLEPADGDLPSSSGAPPPFEELSNREPGIYIHWAIPDALARATVDAETESSLQPDAEAVFPPLPNRWSLTRFAWSGRRYVTRSWMIESDRGRAIPHDEWEETAELPADGGGAATPDIRPHQLTAVLGGDAAWFTVFDNVENRFAFHDDLSDIRDLPPGQRPDAMNYTVTGWYSDDDLDPIAGTDRIGGFDERLAELGWAADTSSLHDEAVALDQLQTQVEQIAELTGTATQATTFGAFADASEATQVSPVVLGTASTVVPAPRVYWPQRSLFHGTIYNVALIGGTDAKPAAAAIDVGLGGTTTDALSSLMAESVDEIEEGAREQLLNALQYGLIAELESPDGPPRLAAEVHRRTFESQPGGFTTEQIRMGDPFAHLRPTPSRNRPVEGGVLSNEVDATYREVLAGGVVFEMIEADPDRTKDVNTRLRADHLDRIVDDDPTVTTSGTLQGGGSGPGGSFLESPADRVGPTLRSSVARPPGLVDGPDLLDTQRLVADAYTRFDGTVTQPRPEQGVEYRTVKRALPRLFYPQDPAIALRGAGRSLRFRNNTTLDEEGRLVCRISGEETTTVPGIVNGGDLLDAPLVVGNVPIEARQLLDEAALNTLGGAANIASVVADSAALTARVAATSTSALERRLVAEDRLYEHSLVPGTSAGDLLTDSIKEGTLASPKAVTAWRQPWEPTYLEWRLELRLDRSVDHWSLHDIDIRPTAELVSDAELEISGRSLVSGAGSNSIADLLAAFIDEEENLDAESGGGVIDDGSLVDLRELNAAAQFADVLSASFDGVRDRLLGYTTNVRITESGTDGEILPELAPELLRAGTATVSALRLVDSFGRFVDVPAPFSVSDDIEVPDETGTDDPDTFLLPPRVMTPARLWFRFVDATDDTRDAFLDQEDASLVRNPVCAWLLPDHVDEALELFDAGGEPLGQLRNERLGTGVVWEGAPGRPGPMGRPPFADIADRHTAEFARSLIELDATERQAGADHGESTLDALLRVVDTTLWTVDPFADSGLDYYAKMTGRPIAVVRARLLLDVVSDAGLFARDDPRHEERRRAFEELSRRKFEARLGSLAQIDDGLLGYFVDDDYRRFHPVHESVPREAGAAGRNTGFLASAGEAIDFDPSAPTPIVHPYVVPDPHVEVQAGHSVRLTLLLDPGTRVHATCGLVPRKSIALPRGFVEDALARIAPSFRFGPLLVDPDVIRMPKPSSLPEDQVWTRRDTPTSWRDDPIEAATQFAYLPDTSHEAQEGYVRVHIDPTAG